MKKPSFDSVAEFLANRNYFDLGSLPTEGQNPKTSDLSNWANHDIKRAIEAVRSIDLDALQVLSQKGSQFSEMSYEMADCLANGGRIFFCGCGATGRLSLALESIWRAERPTQPDCVIGFMAGGDIALVRSVENFEDMPEFGARHLLDLGFCSGDLLISSTEGGETPYVIGATEEAARIAAKDGGRKPFFTYCNPDDILCAQVERSRNVIESPWIRSIAIPLEPMALSGSTRLQASTVQMLGAGLALFEKLDADTFSRKVAAFANVVKKADFSFLPAFIEFEANAAKSGNFLVYETNKFGITILTDTTERSPTFSLKPFENVQDANAAPSLSYLSLPEALDSKGAWNLVLGRLPRGLDWPEYSDRLSTKVALGFDFSPQGIALRDERVKPKRQVPIRVVANQNLEFNFGDQKHSLDIAGLTLLEQHLLLKLILNLHSLLVMGRLGRYEKNVMTWVRPSNGKLIDRTIRYVLHLLANKNIKPSYDEVAQVVFTERKNLGDDEPIVLRVMKEFTAEGKK